MRALWMSIAAVVLLLAFWGVFISHADADINYMEDTIEDAILSIGVEDWGKAESDIEAVSRRWQSRRLVFSLFFDAISMGEIEASLAKAHAYGGSQEKGGCLAELANLHHLLSFLYENEMVTIENIL